MLSDLIDTLLRQRWLATTALVLLTLPFWTSGVAKLVDLGSALAEIQQFGLEPAALIASGTIILQIGGSIMLVMRRASWAAAGALGLFTALATLVAHPFWTFDDPMARFVQRNIFLEHIAIIAGLVLAAIVAQADRAQTS